MDLDRDIPRDITPCYYEWLNLGTFAADQGMAVFSGTRCLSSARWHTPNLGCLNIPVLPW